MLSQKFSLKKVYIFYVTINHWTKEILKAEWIKLTKKAVYLKIKLI